MAKSPKPTLAVAPKLIADGYERLAVCVDARTSPRELKHLEAGLAGKKPLGAQVRLLKTLARKGVIDIAALIRS